MAQIHIDPVIPSDEDAGLAKTARLALAGADVAGKPLRVQIDSVGRDATTLELPRVATRLLLDILEQTEAGKAVSVVSADAEVTSQEAAAILNVSRPYLAGMIDKGVLPARMVDNQPRLPLRDVLAYKADNRARRRETLREMTALDQKLGIL